jgi:hypothetical protein
MTEVVRLRRLGHHGTDPFHRHDKKKADFDSDIGFDYYENQSMSEDGMESPSENVQRTGSFKGFSPLKSDILSMSPRSQSSIKKPRRKYSTYVETQKEEQLFQEQFQQFFEKETDIVLKEWKPIEIVENELYVLSLNNEPGLPSQEQPEITQQHRDVQSLLDGNENENALFSQEKDEQRADLSLEPSIVDDSLPGDLITNEISDEVDRETTVETLDEEEQKSESVKSPHFRNYLFQPFEAIKSVFPFFGSGNERSGNQRKISGTALLTENGHSFGNASSLENTPVVEFKNGVVKVETGIAKDLTVPSSSTSVENHKNVREVNTTEIISATTAAKTSTADLEQSSFSTQLAADTLLLLSTGSRESSTDGDLVDKDVSSKLAVALVYDYNQSQLPASSNHETGELQTNHVSVVPISSAISLLQQPSSQSANLTSSEVNLNGSSRRNGLHRGCTEIPLSSSSTLSGFSSELIHDRRKSAETPNSYDSELLLSYSGLKRRRDKPAFFGEYIDGTPAEVTKAINEWGKNRSSDEKKSISEHKKTSFENAKKINNSSGKRIVNVANADECASNLKVVKLEGVNLLENSYQDDFHLRESMVDFKQSQNGAKTAASCPVAVSSLLSITNPDSLLANKECDGSRTPLVSEPPTSSSRSRRRTPSSRYTDEEIPVPKKQKMVDDRVAVSATPTVIVPLVIPEEIPAASMTPTALPPQKDSVVSSPNGKRILKKNSLFHSSEYV